MGNSEDYVHFFLYTVFFFFLLGLLTCANNLWPFLQPSWHVSRDHQRSRFLKLFLLHRRETEVEEQMSHGSLTSKVEDSGDVPSGNSCVGLFRFFSHSGVTNTFGSV